MVSPAGVAISENFRLELDIYMAREWVDDDLLLARFDGFCAVTLGQHFTVIIIAHDQINVDDFDKRSSWTWLI
jgi:hypothetical protein